MSHSGAEYPAVAVAVKSLLLPSTTAANETPTAEGSVVTRTKRIVETVPAALAPDAGIYPPSKLGENSMFVIFIPDLLKSYLLTVSSVTRLTAVSMPSGPPLRADTAARAAASAPF